MDRRVVFSFLVGLSAVACVGGPFAAVGQRHAPKPAAPRAVTKTTPPPPSAPFLAARTETETPAPEPPRPHAFRVSDLADEAGVSVVHGTVGRHVFLRALADSGLSPKECHRVLAGFSGRDHVDGLNLNHLAQGDSFQYAKAKDGHVVAFELVPAGAMSGSSFDFFQEHEEEAGGHLAAKRVSLPIEHKAVEVGVFLTGTDVPASLAAAGLAPEANALLDAALDGHADLSELRAGARLRVVATALRLDGAPAGYAWLDAVELDPVGKPPLRVYHFAERRGERVLAAGYYDAQGREPYRGAWRTPVAYTHISSRFDPHRVHPVLHVVMPHNGVDFAAPTGTPVYAAAAGTIRMLSEHGPCGNMVQIDHPASGSFGPLTSAYCHLSRFAPLHVGEHVEAHDLIGYVGQTGRATGPHLHFAVKRWTKSGLEVFLNPMAMKLDGVRVVPSHLRKDFEGARKTLDAELDAIPLPKAAPAD